MDNIKTLLKGALGKKVPAEFALEDYDYKAALRDELKRMVPDMKAFRRNKYDVYDLLAEQLDEEFPNDIRMVFGPFADIMQVPQGDRLSFRVRTGMQRGKLFVTRATESGVYETFRLDHDSFDMHTVAIGGAGYVDFERYLDGLEDIADIYEVLLAGMEDRVWEMIQDALIDVFTNGNARGMALPAANKVSTNKFDAQAMTDLCNTVRAYGNPVIYCSPEFAATMSNVITYSVKPDGTNVGEWGVLPRADVDEIRENGYIGKFHGNPIVVLPQSFKDETNTAKVVNPKYAYVIPAGKEKIVKIGFEGDAYFNDVVGQENTMKMQGYKKVGVAIVNRPNYWGIYYNSSLT